MGLFKEYLKMRKLRCQFRFIKGLSFLGKSLINLPDTDFDAIPGLTKQMQTGILEIERGAAGRRSALH